MNLNGKWKLYYYKYGDRPPVKPDELAALPCIDATVPGNVELDLSAAGILPADLFYGENLRKAEPYECYEWWYETGFTPESPASDERVVLRFGAVDCFAAYYLNDEKIGESDNMFIEQEFDVTERLKYGEENTLKVNIHSPAAVTGEIETEVSAAHYSWTVAATSAVNCRKAPHSFGWDIMPRAVSAGIWRDVSLEYRKKYGFNYLYFATSWLSGQDAAAALDFDCRVPPEYVFGGIRVKVTGKCGDSEFKAEEFVLGKTGRVPIWIENAKLWWPRNYGEPNMYDITVSVYGEDGTFLFSETARQGFRTVALDRTDTATENTGRFRFIINGVPVMLVGSNWVPMDAYHSRDKARYQKALELAEDINCNVLRSWGGSVYEDTAFFDWCDEHGMLVWQDFAMACHFYPINDTFAAQMTKEAESVVKKLRGHASLCLWCGDNENDLVLAGSGRNPSLNRITREVLPSVIERLDPTRPYIASSPYISDETFKAGMSALPEDHLWGPRDYYKNKYYTESKAKFISETGYHGCPARKSIEKFVEPEYVWPYQNNPQWVWHSTDRKGNPTRSMQMHYQIQQLFGMVPDNMDDFIAASQISQAEAKKFFIERVRAKMDVMGGIIWWNLLDGWPQFSDAVVDYYYEKKLAYSFIKRSSRPFIVMVDEMAEGGYPVICANSTREEVSGHLTVTNAEDNRIVLETDFKAAPNSNTRLGQVPFAYSDKGMLILKWETDSTYFNTYLYGYPAFDFESCRKWIAKVEAEEQKVK